MSEVRVTDPKTGGAKGLKPERFDLMPWDALEEVARVYHEGAKKYGDHNWAKGYAFSLSIGAAFRHLSKFAMGEDRDAETGCHHMACAAFHCLTLIAFKRRGAGTDDRAKPAAAKPEIDGKNFEGIPVGSRVRFEDDCDSYTGTLSSISPLGYACVDRDDGEEGSGPGGSWTTAGPLELLTKPAKPTPKPGTRVRVRESYTKSPPDFTNPDETFEGELVGVSKHDGSPLVKRDDGVGGAGPDGAWICYPPEHQIEALPS